MKIAIVAAAGRFPGANDLDELWRLVVERRSAAREVPEGRWPVEPRSLRVDEHGIPDRLVSTRGCYVELPAGDETLDPVHRLALAVGEEAFARARTAGVDRSRAAVILANILLPTETLSATTRATLGAAFREWATGKAAEPASTDVMERHTASLPAALLAQRLGLGGGAFTLDAACASSLYALHLACADLEAGRIDLALAGGVSHPQNLYTQVGFTQLNALSPSGACRPFDDRADGLVVGEGAAIFVLKRLEDAEAAGDEILGVIRGIGLSNDVGGSLLSPEREGQMRAMRAAFDAAGLSPSDVDLVECHGTGTPRGDAVELSSLAEVYADCTPAIGSVKGNVGHLLTAAGGVALCKVLLALRERTLPPAGGFEGREGELGLRLLRSSEEWKSPEDRPRRAAVSAFGFGGINAHLLVEEWRAPAPTAAAVVEVGVREEPIAVVGMAAHFGRLDSLRAFGEAALRGETLLDERPAARHFGLEESGVGVSALSSLRGGWIERLRLRLGRFKIPPKELPTLLPQQLLLLQCALDAAEDVASFAETKRPRLRAGALVGIGLDPETTTFHLRWLLLHDARAWAAEEGLQLSEHELQAWVDAMLPALGAGLDSSRTLGALGGVAAGRIARELSFGGPSFAVSAAENSGLRALEIASRLLQRREVDAMIVAAADLAGDPRSMLATDGLRHYSRNGRTLAFDPAGDGPTPGEGGCAVFLKRLEDARRDGDRIYAVIRGFGAASGDVPGRPSSETGARAISRAFEHSSRTPDELSLIEATGSGDPVEDEAELKAFASALSGEEKRTALGSARATIGETYAAAGLASFVKAAWALHQRILPALPGTRSLRVDVAPLHLPRDPQYFFHDGEEGERLAAVNSIGSDGSWHHVLLEGHHCAGDARPLGERGTALFLIRGDDREALAAGFSRLRALASGTLSLEQLAAAWHRLGGNAGRHCEAIVASSHTELLRQLEREVELHEPLKGDVTFVYPGSGNHWIGMGRALFAAFPEVPRALEKETGRLRTQMMPAHFAPWLSSWRKGAEADALREVEREPARLMLSQVAYGIATTELLARFGVTPTATIGYSLGESAANFSLRTWRDRDGMFERTLASPLFTDQLAGRCEVAARKWGVERADWHVVVVNRGRDEVRASLRGTATLLIVNAPGECVVGGRREDVEASVAALGCESLPIAGVPTVHCDILDEVADAYRALHLHETTPPPGVRQYSCGWARAFEPTRESCADSILQNARAGFDYPKVIERAFEDGARIFVEPGPQGSCTRMIGRILGGREHLAVAIDGRGDPLRTLLQSLGRLAEAGVAVDLEWIYGEAGGIELPRRDTAKYLEIPVGRPRPSLPAPPWKKRAAVTPAAPRSVPQDMPQHAAVNLSTDRIAEEVTIGGGARQLMSDENEATHAMGAAALPSPAQLLRNAEATARAHEVWLQNAQQLFSLQQQAAAMQQQLMARLAVGGASHLATAPPPPVNELRPPAPTAEAAQVNVAAVPSASAAPTSPPRSLDRAQCMEFAIGSIGKVLGPDFAAIDAHPTRVRLPDEPLMLVDRIVEIEGEPLAMSSGRVVTEHDVLPGAWYLDGGRAPVCISVESGQADLFLCAWAGIDFHTRGERVYRLLDAQVVFHRDLPREGETVRYDIRVHKFIRQGDTWLLFFEFDGTIGNEKLITMRSGCAGFFSPAQLASGRGIVGELPSDRPVRREGTIPFSEIVPVQRCSFDDEAIEALRRGDLEAAFGPLFSGLTLAPSMRLPGGRMALVDRILELDPDGGRHGLGRITGEADIAPDDWFLTCHFSDDKVMPGTLMYECCLHTLRVMLLRMGWIAEEGDDVHFAPVVGATSKLRCRGQVIETTKKVRYRVDIKEIGYDPEPYVLADASMFVDDLHAIEMEGMSLRIAGLTREQVEGRFRRYDRQHILEFAEGSPARAFGAAYDRFEGERMARLPRPPFSFIDEIVPRGTSPFVLKKGSEAFARYLVDPRAWYFAASRQGSMPYAVLLEAALQPCGWLAAYSGSALRSDEPLFFRNLEGEAKLHRPVLPDEGELRTHVRLDSFSEAGGMILQHFRFETSSDRGPVFDGWTRFGFFPEASLAQQAGLRETPTLPEGRGLRELPRIPPLLPHEAGRIGDPLRDASLVQPAFEYGTPAGAWLLLSRIDHLDEESALASWDVDGDAWFFAAHFLGDPVMPGSLGVEAFLQLVAEWARHRHPGALRVEMPAQSHAWTYRGQVRPHTKQVQVCAQLEKVGDGHYRASGHLLADGLPIYSMRGYELRVLEED